MVVRAQEVRDAVNGLEERVSVVVRKRVRNDLEAKWPRVPVAKHDT
eukprot:CAMPEP_0170173620 /NCGR_PEP_ID=MMETSP0040_2-20121228/6904_1 /TAXON_ID=641309 /ORGANISM="Lotharella oceanica, Strain CCMP622" /LENGTH=45 /DNA_ID= /DNA_START= /DNA_END= /DNA_ORIENTATION=